MENGSTGPDAVIALFGGQLLKAKAADRDLGVCRCNLGKGGGAVDGIDQKAPRKKRPGVPPGPAPKIENPAPSGEQSEKPVLYGRKGDVQGVGRKVRGVFRVVAKRLFFQISLLQVCPPSNSAGKKRYLPGAVPHMRGILQSYRRHG